MWLLVCIVIASSGSAVAVQPRSSDWSTSAEAAFLTRDEAAKWKTLRSDEERERFKIAYWQRRDPTPDTERNEFKETILTRIRIADRRFPLGKKPGSQTARGRVFVVLGAPSEERQTIGPLNRSPEMIAPGRMGLPSAAFETTEWHTWVYDQTTAGELSKIIERQSAEISFIVEPGRSDRIQSGDIFERWREKVAQRSIVNPETRPDGPPPIRDDVPLRARTGGWGLGAGGWLLGAWITSNPGNQNRQPATS